MVHTKNLQKSEHLLDFLKISLKFFFGFKNSTKIWFCKSFRSRYFSKVFCQSKFAPNYLLTGPSKPKFHISLILYGFYEDALWLTDETYLSFTTILFKNFDY